MFWDCKGAPGKVLPSTSSALRRSHRAFSVAGLMFLILLLAAGCGRGQSVMTETKDDYQVAFATDPAPPNRGAGTIVVTIKDQQGQGVDAARISIEANMNHAGMKPEFSEITSGAGGEYRLPLNWSMGGAWYVDVNIILHNGEVVRRRFPVDVK